MQRLKEQVERDLKRLGNSDFKSCIIIFRDPGMLASLTMEIIEATATVFEIRVTDCLSALQSWRYRLCRSLLGRLQLGLGF